MIAVVTMETIAANLGSMATPVGNPQNLYLYSVSGMSLGEFIKVMGPLSVLSLFLILMGCLLQKNQELQITVVSQGKKEPKIEENLLLCALFVVSLLAVYFCGIFHIYWKYGKNWLGKGIVGESAWGKRTAFGICRQSGNQQCASGDSAVGIYKELCSVVTGG